MIEIEKGIFIAKEEEIASLDPSKYAFVSVAHTFHYAYHKWARGESHQEDPCYVIHEEDNLLSVNWVDGNKYLYNWKGSGVMVFKRVLDFILKQYLKEKPVVIFCNQATSRAPTVALVFLAKRLHKISSYDFATAQIDFIQKYPEYKPGGIAEFVAENWENL